MPSFKEISDEPITEQQAWMIQVQTTRYHPAGYGLEGFRCFKIEDVEDANYGKYISTWWCWDSCE